MHKTLKRKFDLRLLRFFVAFGVLVLPSVFLYAEDLTTLDGKTFTNITEVTFNVTNVLEVVDHTCSIWVDAKGFNFGVLTDSAHSADKKTHDACFGFKYGEEKTAGQIFEKFIQWQKTAATNNVESFSKEIANVFVPHQTVLGSDSQCSFTFLWEKDSLYAGENARLQVSFYPEATGFSSGFLRVEDVLAFDKLLKSVPELKDELLQKIKNQEAQKNLFK
jgi:hypothetical protein